MGTILFSRGSAQVVLYCVSLVAPEFLEVSPSGTLEIRAAIPLAESAIGASGVGAVGADVVGNGMTAGRTGITGSDMGVPRQSEASRSTAASTAASTVA